MSYCRKSGDSDVYVIATHNPKKQTNAWWCCGCYHEANFFDTRQEMLEHLLQHRLEGDKVPERALDRLRKEIAAE